MHMTYACAAVPTERTAVCKATCMCFYVIRTTLVPGQACTCVLVQLRVLSTVYTPCPVHAAGAYTQHASSLK